MGILLKLGAIWSASWASARLVRNAVSLFITYRPLLLAVVAAIHAAIAATAEGETKPALASDTNVRETIITALQNVATSTTLSTFTAGGMTQTRVKVPPGSPPVWNLSVVNSEKNRRGWRTGFCTITLEQGL